MASQRQIYDQDWEALLLSLPSLLILAVFLYYPALRTFRLSTFRVQFFGQNRQFVGLENYIELLTDSAYQESALLSFLFVIVVVAGTIIVSLGVAFLIHEVREGESWYLIGAIWPYALPPAVAGTILLFLLHPGVGIVALQIENLLGLTLDWRTDGTVAFLLIGVATVWKQLGFNIIFLIAALNNIPESLTEASVLDGVGRLQLLRKVYLPLISPTVVFLVVMNSIFAFFYSFPMIDIITRGGPNSSTTILIYKLYLDAFQYQNYGAASAQSIILFGIVAILVALQLFVSDRLTHYGV
jgi:sn-glycerol 3-phosphate transport system permease protein